MCYKIGSTPRRTHEPARRSERVGFDDMRDLLWVAGGRNYDNQQEMSKHLLKYTKREMPLITGGATGADHLAEQIWRNAQLPLIVIPARWRIHGIHAGPMRNRQIATEWKPTLLVLFPGGAGTASAQWEADQFNIPWVAVPE